LLYATFSKEQSDMKPPEYDPPPGPNRPVDPEPLPDVEEAGVEDHDVPDVRPYP
jgi:hypothetical protein